MKQGFKLVFPLILLALLIPIIIAFSVFFGDESSFALTSVAVIFVALIAMFLSIENRKTSIRLLTATAVVTAISVVGRLVFAPIPAFKPVTAIVIICAMYFGSCAGFLCGSLSALISNFYFGQGPWTPIQMFTWGLLGLLAGLLAKRLKSNTFLLGVYAAVSGVAYSLIVDVWSVQWFSGGFNLELYFTSVAASLPFMLMYIVSNIVFALVLNRLCKRGIERIVVKYIE